MMGYVSSRYLFVGSGLNLIPWGALAFFFGVFARTKSRATRLGATYGFAQSFLFLWIDKSGSTSAGQFFALVAITTLLGLFGALCGGVLARGGWALSGYVLKSPAE